MVCSQHLDLFQLFEHGKGNLINCMAQTLIRIINAIVGPTTTRHLLMGMEVMEVAVEVVKGHCQMSTKMKTSLPSRRVYKYRG